MGFLKLGKRNADDAGGPNPLRQVADACELFEAIGDGIAVIYKHSNRCGICFRTLKEMRMFAERHPDIPVLMIDVNRDPRVSNHVAQHFGVRHESPQALLVHGERALWDGSHLGVTAREVEAALA